MIDFFVALGLIVLMMLGYLLLVQIVIDPGSPLWRTRLRLRQSAQVRREIADLDREYASLVDEHRHIP